MNKQDTQSKLIETATPLFATKGFAAVSVREVTDAAKINVSAISYHFNGKEGLYQAVLEEQFAPMLQARQAVNNMSLSPVERLRFYAEQIARVHGARPYLSRFMIGELTTPTAYGGKIIEKHLSQVYKFIHDALEEGIKNGEFSQALHVPHAAIALAGILNFYFITKPLIRQFINTSGKSDAEYAKQAFEIYLHGILKS